MKTFLTSTGFMLLIAVLVFGMFVPAGLAKKKDIDYGSYDQVAVAKGGMVSTAHPLASEIGAEVLEKGGNAMDAAIAIQFALTVTEPMMSGIGGGGFMMVYDAETG